VNRLKIQRLESRRKTRDIYKVVGCLMPYRLGLDISSAEAQLGQDHATVTITGDCRQLKGLKFLPFYLFCSLLLGLLTLIWPCGLRRRLGCLSIPPLLICAKTTINKHVKRLGRRFTRRLAHVPTVGLHVLVLWRVSPMACHRVDAVAPDAYLKYHRNKLYSNLVVM
jgi:hypothetical protein